MIILQLLMVTGFMLVHVFAGKLKFLEGILRSSWLSFDGGISVAYVFLHLLPEISEAQQRINKEAKDQVFAEQFAYSIVLIGLALFYGLKILVKSSQPPRENSTAKNEGETTTGMGVFWLQIASFALSNAIIGYLLLHLEDQEQRRLLFFTVSMVLHFIVNGYGL